jgi:hypothetical protein
MSDTAHLLEYKGRPLRRMDNLVYYGSMADKFVVMLQITDAEKVSDLDLPKKVTVQLQLTDPDVKSRDRVVRETKKDSFYEAIDVAAVWLERALSGR